jgi:hypothetical protein
MSSLSGGLNASVDERNSLPRPAIIDDLTTGVLCDDILLLSKNMPPPLELELIIY